MQEILKLLIEKNPGLVNIFLTGIILPIGILWLNNRNSKNLKVTEKDLEQKYKSKDDIRDQEKKVYSSLSRILFNVQQLHVALSGTCIDTSCIQNGLEKFDLSLSKCHEDISNNMLYLSSDAINLVYSFYNEIGQLKTALQELDKKEEYELAHVTVYYSSQKLADLLIEVQDLFLKQKVELRLQFDKTKQEMMRYCCGEEPPHELKEKYERLKANLNQHHQVEC